MQDPDLKCRHFGILWYFGIMAIRNQIRFFQFYPIFRLFPTFRLSDSTALVPPCHHVITCHLLAPPSSDASFMNSPLRKCLISSLKHHISTFSVSGSPSLSRPASFDSFYFHLLYAKKINRV